MHGKISASLEMYMGSFEYLIIMLMIFCEILAVGIRGVSIVASYIWSKIKSHRKNNSASNIVKDEIVVTQSDLSNRKIG